MDALDDDADADAALLADRYRLVERVGEGSSGVVYRSFDRELEDWVAVKLLRGGPGSDAGAGLRREVKLARRVSHPNVARVFEFGRVGAQQFLTMEYLGGESLHHLLTRAGPLPPDHVVGLAIALCDGLVAAHEVGVVHGDVKPANVVLAPDRGAVLTDFGIARALVEPGTRAGYTPYYAAPELLRGDPTTPATDLYALGVLLFEALTGAVPGSGGDTLQAVADRLAQAAAPDLHPLPAGLSTAWFDLLAACLDPQPERRPRDARALLAHLHTLPRAAAAPGAARLPSPPPLGSGPGPRWLAVPPFHSDDPALQRECAWISADLVQALRQVRSLRVASDGPGPAAGPLVQLHGRVSAGVDGVRVVVRVADPEAPAADHELILDHPRGRLPGIGVELAAAVLADLGLRARAVARPDTLPDDAVDRYILARAALLELRTADALAHFEAALARAPGHPALQIGHVTARVRHTVLFRSPSPAEFAELRALVEATTLAHSGAGEIAMAMAGLLHSQSEPIEAMRWACTAVARAPSLGTLCMIGSVLAAIGRLPDAARRYDIAAALERSNAVVWLCRAELAAYEGRWSDFDAIVDGPLAELRVHTVYTAQMMLWRPAPASLERIALALAEGRQLGRPEALRDLAAVVDFLRDDGARRPQIFAELAARHVDGPRSYHTRRMLTILCDMACMLADLDGARALLDRADAMALIEWQWLISSPNLAPLRDDPHYLAIRDRVRERADAVAEVIWG